jgi:hypothetical protein
VINYLIGQKRVFLKIRGTRDTSASLGPVVVVLGAVIGVVVVVVSGGGGHVDMVM